MDTEFLICFDTSTLNTIRMPYPLPVVENSAPAPMFCDDHYVSPTSSTGTSTVTPYPHEQAVITGLFPDSDPENWTVALHIAFPDNWDSYWAARTEASWPLFTLHCTDNTTIEVRMYRFVYTHDPEPIPKVQKEQTIKAIVRDNSGGVIATLALPTAPGFYAHSGSPIWIAISLKESETMTFAGE